MWKDVVMISLLAISLSIDIFAVSVSIGVGKKKIHISQIVKIAFFFAFFHSLMPLIGWFAGEQLIRYIEFVDHWIAFALLLFIGVRMIREGVIKREKNKLFDNFNLLLLLGVSLSTSVDALIVGFSFPVINLPVTLAVVLIGVITFFVSIIGVFIGKKSVLKYGTRMEIIGGIILIAIGVKIVLEHEGIISII